jgi:hypothetical protein
VQELCNAVQAASAHQAVAAQLLTDVVAEMNPITASSLALPWSFHERCRTYFSDNEHEPLLRIFHTVSEAAVRSADANPTLATGALLPAWLASCQLE